MQQSKIMPIYGLVLAGGESRRMGRDKALLSYGDGVTQLERMAGLLNSVCEQVYISQRTEQEFPIPAEAQALYDAVDAFKGPLCGILSAQQANPQAHWLVVACDLPNLKLETLGSLIKAFREVPPQLTAYRSSHDGLPEPLCAIYPAGIGPALETLARDLGKSCPRKLLIVKDARLIEQEDPRSLDNINTAEEFKEITNQAN